ncbi:MAG: divalent-cation tolerance protein CutA [Candidatus Marinimicrobia bacterium]|nr:divalent-cation tolerance protein CutA [Candidatus Neomarinimicrobiota bacterium]MCF7828326.1 divalent-cation tolerance protein CutA [Candidatus Neomarinimicrobiota bacterium]MCF7879499.1 divalent-cation tolerance protein CutA [Candidatus Neomarinimicrobiota bacterium]
MTNDISPVVILITCGNSEEAQTISNTLVRRKLIACGNIVPEITSIFNWEKKVTHDSEVLVIAKSQNELFDEVVKVVKELHSYQTPEIIALPVIKGSEDYLTWLVDETSAEDG